MAKFGWGQSRPPGAMRCLTRKCGACPSWGRPGTLLPSKLVEQCLGFLQDGRIEAVGEPAVGRCEEIAGGIALALLAPEPGEADRSAQLPELRASFSSNTFGQPNSPKASEISCPHRASWLYSAWSSGISHSGAIGAQSPTFLANRCRRACRFLHVHGSSIAPRIFVSRRNHRRR